MEDANAYYETPLGPKFYDLFTGNAHNDGPVKGDVDFYVECAREFGAPVLELATGTGRVAWPIAVAGFEVTGLDISSGMLDVARAKADVHDAATRKRLRLVQMDMTSFALDRSFSLAIVPFRAFQHLVDPEQQRSCLQCVYRALVPRGHLVIDIFDPRLEWCVPGAPSPNPDRRAIDPQTGHTIRRRVAKRENDPIRQVVTEWWKIEEIDTNGTVVATDEASWSLRWATRQEMRYLFELAGFEVVGEYSDFFRASPDYGKEQIWVVRKGFATR